MSIIFIHNFYFEKIYKIFNKKLLPQIRNFVPTLYEPSYFFEIENKNPIIIDTNKYKDQNIYIVKDNKIENFYENIINIDVKKNKLFIYHNFKEKKKFFLFF